MSLEGTYTMKSTPNSTEASRPILDLTTADNDLGSGPTIDLRSPARPADRARCDEKRQISNGLPPTPADDVIFLAEVLMAQETQVISGIDLSVDELTAVTEDPTPNGDITRGWGDWGPRDNTDLGRIVTPRIVTTARRLYKMMTAGRPLFDSPGQYYQTHRRFSADYMERNLASLFEESSAKPGDGIGDPIDLTELRHAAQYRLEYFVGLPDAEFDACFRFTGEITRDYLLHVARSERLYAERRHSSAPTAGSDRRKRKARALHSG
ncbi:MAG: hypothetical protein OER95_18915 [Acidimicrobiia bacterium]|nr:hypothetical protein [Acidimicrobiia bacterium]